MLIAIAVIRLRDLFAVVMLFGIYSFITAALFMDLDAVDVAFTEAAVGAGVTGVLMLSTLRLTGRWERRPCGWSTHRATPPGTFRCSWTATEACCSPGTPA